MILLKSSSLTPQDFKQLNILTLRNRLLFNKAVLMHKVNFDCAPIKISNKFMVNNHRHKHLFAFPRPRNNLFKNTFLYSGGNLWNNLPTEFKTINNIDTFKRRFKDYLMQNQTYENIWFTWSDVLFTYANFKLSYVCFTQKNEFSIHNSIVNSCVYFSFLFSFSSIV